MYSNKFVTILVTSFLVFFLISNVTMSFMHDKTTKQVEYLEVQMIENKIQIEAIKVQIRDNELESARLESMISIHTDAIKKVKEKPIENKTDPNEMLLAQLIESESGNQPYKGKLAVGTVVMNRVSSDEFPDNIKDVIYQKKQFSVVSNGTIRNKPSDDSIKAAKEILDGKRVLDSNILYFYNPKFTNDRWIKSLKIDKIIEDHIFAYENV